MIWEQEGEEEYQEQAGLEAPWAFMPEGLLEEAGAQAARPQKSARGGRRGFVCGESADGESHAVGFCERGVHSIGG